ncbi:SAM-dependent methyltransferase [Streptomyces sp. CSDS2]|uniref:SAM-dependent methyltransferase n=1 Tax=Streptomyces sp. CSDS2 TaxID=3055051 RepID=UPI0025B09414|nr:SAM-dependent methyltransferase [Streptomyces sp. CSDS2]MDN3262826.1 SAM-dependent methyltransferase [Streptomyces sp. CSDS2]
MSTTRQWIPDGMDRGVASAARAYDYLLGGTHHFEADRKLAEQVLSVLPANVMARQNRDYLQRVVRFLVDSGIRQFIDLGSGLPVMGNVHEVAQQLDPECRVIYVDNEPASVAHSELILSGAAHTAIVEADVREVTAVLNADATRRLIDFSRPVGLLMLGVTQFLHDEDDPWAITSAYREALPSGSFLALSCFTWDNDPETMRNTIEMFRKSGRSPIVPRTRAEVIRLIGDLELLDPGLVFTPQWRPDAVSGDSEERSNLYAGVARKP